MYIIIVGAGATALSLVELAIKAGHEVAIIESDVDRAKSILSYYEVQVFQADIAEGGILEEARADRAEALFAVTVDDSANLMAMLLGKEHGIPNLVALLRDSRHKTMFERLGVRVLTNPHMPIAEKLFSLINS